MQMQIIDVLTPELIEFTLSLKELTILDTVSSHISSSELGSCEVPHGLPSYILAPSIMPLIYKSRSLGIESPLIKTLCLAINASTNIGIQMLEQAMELDSDKFLIQMVKLQSFVEEINDALPRQTQEFMHGSAAPIQMCIRTLQSKLESFRRKLPLNLQQNRKLFLSSSVELNDVLTTNSSIPTHALPLRPRVSDRNCSHLSPINPTSHSPRMSRLNPRFFLLHVLHTSSRLA
jgi:hypothetical protein